MKVNEQWANTQTMAILVKSICSNNVLFSSLRFLILKPLAIFAHRHIHLTALLNSILNIATLLMFFMSYMSHPLTSLLRQSLKRAALLFELVSFQNSSLFTLIFSWLCFSGFLEFWFWHRTHLFSFSSLSTYLVMSAACLIYGSLVAQKISMPAALQEKPFQLLLGFFIFNTLLFLMTFLGSLKVITSFWLLTAGSLLLLRKNYKYFYLPPLSFKEELPGLLCLILSGLGATLWCHDALSLPINNGRAIFFPIWQDSFLHARLISVFAQADGIHVLPNLSMKGLHMGLYHYGSYLMAAVMVAVTPATAYEIFSCFLLPVGIFLSGLAAFSLASSLWGKWPGLAAILAVVFFPDAYQQGFQNKFLSYHFLQQVGPAGLYGTACVAVAWIFILEGCREKKLPLLVLGYVFLAITVFYKAQLFVANAFLILIYPCFFFLQCRTRWRLLAGLLLTLLFCNVIAISQHSSSIPIIRLDGSSLHRYATMLSNCTNPGRLHDFLLEKFATHPFRAPWYQMGAGIMIFFYTLGVWGPLWIITTFSLRPRTEKAILIFPLAIIINYLIMSLGLAFNTNHIGMPEELAHRPFVWAYFAVTSWTAGGLYFVFFENRFPKGLLGRMICLLILLVSFTTPLFFAHGLQTMPLWGKTLTSNAVPVDMLKAINFIRNHSSSFETLQDSEGDPYFIVTGLTERQAYAITNSELNISAPPVLTTRLQKLEVFKKIQSEKDLLSFLQTHSMDWYLLHPDTIVAWPDSFKNKVAFVSGGYRVYHWPHH